MGAECGRDSAAGAARKGFRAERVDAVLGRSDFAGPWAWHPAICDPETCAQNAHQLRRKRLSTPPRKWGVKITRRGGPHVRP